MRQAERKQRSAAARPGSRWQVRGIAPELVEHCTCVEGRYNRGRWLPRALTGAQRVRECVDGRLIDVDVILELWAQQGTAGESVRVEGVQGGCVCSNRKVLGTDLPRCRVGLQLQEEVVQLGAACVAAFWREQQAAQGWSGVDDLCLCLVAGACQQVCQDVTLQLVLEFLWAGASDLRQEGVAQAEHATVGGSHLWLGVVASQAGAHVVSDDQLHHPVCLSQELEELFSGVLYPAITIRSCMVKGLLQS